MAAPFSVEMLDKNEAQVLSATHLDVDLSSVKSHPRSIFNHTIADSNLLLEPDAIFVLYAAGYLAHIHIL